MKILIKYILIVLYFLSLSTTVFCENTKSGYEKSDSTTECICKEDQGVVRAAKRFASKVSSFIHEYVVPKTDEDCKWIWSHWRCDPQCECAIKFKFGDYSPGRACRKKAIDELDPRCDPYDGDDICLTEKFAGFVVKMAKKAVQLAKKAKDFTFTHIVPKTDAECKFNVHKSLKERRLVCHPDPACSFQFKLGDFHLGRSCRLRKAHFKPSSSFYDSLFSDGDQQ
mmetsp:Transcript_34659/g.44215  ORF Transcript_34659/g.44215 Transcript_34659/m.44215 type:complete len:225 (+) Transcript_34659:59-733(+)